MSKTRNGSSKRTKSTGEKNRQDIWPNQEYTAVVHATDNLIGRDVLWKTAYAIPKRFARAWWNISSVKTSVVLRSDILWQFLSLFSLALIKGRQRSSPCSVPVIEQPSRTFSIMENGTVRDLTIRFGRLSSTESTGRRFAQESRFSVSPTIPSRQRQSPCHRLCIRLRTRILFTLIWKLDSGKFFRITNAKRAQKLCGKRGKSIKKVRKRKLYAAFEAFSDSAGFWTLRIICVMEFSGWKAIKTKIRWRR